MIGRTPPPTGASDRAHLLQRLATLPAAFPEAVGPTAPLREVAHRNIAAKLADVPQLLPPELYVLGRLLYRSKNAFRGALFLKHLRIVHRLARRLLDALTTLSHWAVPRFVDDAQRACLGDAARDVVELAGLVEFHAKTALPFVRMAVAHGHSLSTHMLFIALLARIWSIARDVSAAHRIVLDAAASLQPPATAPSPAPRPPKPLSPSPAKPSAKKAAKLRKKSATKLISGF